MSKLIKWSGSKNTQAEKIITYIPNNIENYYEPFLGGGSVFLELLESRNIENYILSDINKELIGIYNLVKNNTKLLIETYNEHYLNFNKGTIQDRKDYFAFVRSNFNINRNPEDFYWIMRTTTNGMPRYNRKGEFNNSCHFSRPGMKPEEVEKIILNYSKLFNNKNIKFINCGYTELKIKSNSLIYCDPPYEQTKGMYFGNFNNKEFINWLNNIKEKWLLSYDGKVNDNKIEHISPNFKRHEYLISGNSSFRRVIGNSKNSIISESLYLNF